MNAKITIHIDPHNFGCNEDMSDEQIIEVLSEAWQELYEYAEWEVVRDETKTLRKEK